MISAAFCKVEGRGMLEEFRVTHTDQRVGCEEK